MAKRETYIKKVELVKHYKNLTVSINTMIDNDAEFIMLGFEINIGQYCVRMLDNLDDIQTIPNIVKKKIATNLKIKNDILIYSKKIANLNKQRTSFIIKQINTIETIKTEQKYKLKKLIDSCDNDDNNDFFDNSKSDCIDMIYNNVINSDIGSKRLYTQLKNKVYWLNANLKDIDISKINKTNILSVKEYQLDNLTDLIKDDRKYEKTIFLEHILDNILEHSIYYKDFINITTKKHIQKYKTNRIDTIEDYMNECRYEQEYPSQDVLEELIYERKLEIKEELFEEIINERLEICKDIFGMIKPLLTDYFDIKEFSKTKIYKRQTTMIKKFYQNKLQNIKRHKYNHYITDFSKRYEKLDEMEYLDNFFKENEQIIKFIYCLDISENESDYFDLLVKPIISIEYDNQRNILSKVYQSNNSLSDFEKVFNSLQIATDLVVEKDGYKGDFSYGYTINIVWDCK